MENSSAIFYRESSFQEAQDSDNPVPHEIAHQWFGDSVTPADWDDLWLSEGFATYLEALFNQHEQGPESLNQTMAAYAEKLEKYGPARSSPVVDPNQLDPVKKLNALTYDKGAWVLHMLRGMLGDPQFFKGIRRYYSLYEGKNASSDDFKKVMERTSGIPLSSFFKQWLHQAGWPEYAISWHWNDATSEVEVSIRQTQSAGLFDMPLDIAFLEENLRETRRLRICNAEHSFRIPLRAKPLSIEIDPDGWALKSVSVVQF